jgi:HEPN/RES N-terminal domain 1/RES domain
MIELGAVCAECFGDQDIRERILEADGEPGCDFCGEEDAPTIDIDDLGAQMLERLDMFYSDANNHLMYISREGGFQGITYLTYDLLMDEEQVDLPRDRDGKLFSALIEAIEPDRVWCEHDPAVLPENESMLLDWDRFCRIIKYERRFFFQNLGGPRNILDDSLAAADLLNEICRFIDGLDILETREAGTTLYRARPWNDRRPYTLPHELGPPRRDQALQTNRMNPPGIPMFYGAEDARTAIVEIRDSPAFLGIFVTRKPVTLLDLANLPPIPGTFSRASRESIVALRFLHQFADVITQPVDRDNRTHLDYVPTQVLTEYVRDYTFTHGKVDGIRYPSALMPRTEIPNDGLFAGVAGGANVVLFATQADVVGGEPDDSESTNAATEPWLSLVETRQYENGTLGRPTAAPAFPSASPGGGSFNT